MPPILTSFPPSTHETAKFFTTVSVVMIANAASSEPCVVSEAASPGIAAAIGSIGSTCPMTPVEATITSFGRSPSASAVSEHIFMAFCTPSALQVLALPLLQMTACAPPSFRFSFVTRIGAPLTRFCV